MRREMWRSFLQGFQRPGVRPPAATAISSRPSRLRAIGIPAIVIALPLLALGFLLSGWLDADDAVKRRTAQEQAKSEGQRIEAAALAALDARLRAVFARIEAVRREVNPNDHLRQMIYSREVSYVLIRRGSELLFPSRDDWTFPDIEDQRRQLLTVAAELHARLDPPQGWYAGVSGIVFFRCDRAESDSVCVALDEASLRPDLVGALNAAASRSQGCGFVLRDSFNRMFWNSALNPPEDASAFAMGDALRGWTIQVGALAPARTSPARVVAMSVPLAFFWVYVIVNLARRQSERWIEAERRKNFLDRIAHDLRTPLANLKLFCELVAQETSGNARAAEHCAILSAEVDRLDRVAANAMTFGRSAPPQLRKAIPDEILTLLLERFSPRLAADKRTCTITASETKPLVFDVAAFERILVNLLDNACKYAEGPICVATAFEAGMLRLEIADRGPGLTEARAPEGSGLGLSIVQDLAKANGGAVALINGQPGLRVVVTIQARRAEDGDEAAGG